MTTANIVNDLFGSRPAMIEGNFSAITENLANMGLKLGDRHELLSMQTGEVLPYSFRLKATSGGIVYGADILPIL